jgi:hypothetical protein
MVKRVDCVICGGKLQFLYKRDKYPIKLSPTVDEEDADIFNDLIFCNCTNCGTVQLEELIDPTILYSENHNNTSSSALWNKHNEYFYNFIKRHNKQKNEIIEIGGSDGTLLRKFAGNDYEKYTIIDLCNDVKFAKLENVFYEKKNCETDILPNGNIIIMSHVLEHLYNPRLFLENVYKNTNISEIYISIPNMEYLLESKSYSFLHFEHTYYICKENFNILANNSGWKVGDYSDFQNHSLFIKLYRDVPSYKNDCIVDYNKLYDYFSELENKLKNIKISVPSYFFPGGHFGQLLMYYLDSESKKNIINFVDNDITKQGKRIYGTNKTMIAFNSISQSNTFAILNTPYSEEIINQILNNFNDPKIIRFS